MLSQLRIPCSLMDVTQPLPFWWEESMSGNEDRNSQRRATFAQVRHSIRGCFLCLASVRSPWLQMLGFRVSPPHHLLLLRLSEHCVMEGIAGIPCGGRCQGQNLGLEGPSCGLFGDIDVPCSSRNVLLDWVTSLAI